MSNPISIRQTEGKDTWELVYLKGDYSRERVLLNELTEFKACDLGCCIARAYERGRIDAKIEIRKALEL